MRKLSAILALPVLTIAVAACGSSTSSSTSTASTTTHAASSAKAKAKAKTKKESAKAKASTKKASAKKAATPVAAGVIIKTATVPGVGMILVNGQGRTLYTFAPDKKSKVTCTDSCASVWPPVRAAAGKAHGTKQVKASLLSTDTNPSGGKVVTYAGWPLYTYLGDSGPGTAKGQAVNLNGGLWYVITPAGKVVTKKQ